MGISPFPLLLTLMAAAAPVPPPQPMGEEPFQQLLQSADAQAAEQACLDPSIASSDRRRQDLRDRLLALHPVVDSLDVVLADAGALLSCGAPESAAVVLSRYSPLMGEERRRWLLIRWQAADAARDHRQAALALRRLVNGNLKELDAVVLLPDQQNGLDQLAFHEAALRRLDEAAAVVLQGSLEGVTGARRMAQAAEWLGPDQLDQADQLLETALDQAAAERSWGLAMDLLRQQLELQQAAGGDGARPRQRLERLAILLEDRYSLETLQPDETPDPLLRSPRAPGGHAAVGDTTVAPSP